MGWTGPNVAAAKARAPSRTLDESRAATSPDAGHGPRSRNLYLRLREPSFGIGSLFLRRPGNAAKRLPRDHRPGGRNHDRTEAASPDARLPAAGVACGARRRRDPAGRDPRVGARPHVRAARRDPHVRGPDEHHADVRAARVLVAARGPSRRHRLGHPARGTGRLSGPRPHLARRRPRPPADRGHRHGRAGVRRHLPRDQRVRRRREGQHRRGDDAHPGARREHRQRHRPGRAVGPGPVGPASPRPRSRPPARAARSSTSSRPSARPSSPSPPRASPPPIRPPARPARARRWAAASSSTRTA